MPTFAAQASYLLHAGTCSAMRAGARHTNTRGAHVVCACRILIVPPESAYTGFGDSLTLPDRDHITVCKPTSPASVAYTVVRDIVAAAAAAMGSAGAG